MSSRGCISSSVAVTARPLLRMPVTRAGEPTCEPLHQMAQTPAFELLPLLVGTVGVRQIVRLAQMIRAVLRVRHRRDLFEQRVEALARGCGRAGLEVGEGAVRAVP